MNAMPQIHTRLLTIDTHIDIPWPDRGDAFGPSDRRVDFAKMRAGGLKAGCFAAYIPQGPRTGEGEAAAFERAKAMLGVINKMAGSQNGITVRVAHRAAEIEAAAAAGAIAVIPAVENGYAIGTDLARLDVLAGLGARYMTLTHNGHNALADSAIPRTDLGDPPTIHDGLSALGRKVIARMNELGLLVDISHVSKTTMLQALALSKTPVIATHASIHALCHHPRNLDDEQLDALGKSGGVIQITAVPAFLKHSGKADTVTIANFADHIDYAVERIGIEHVGIGSDFDGGGGFIGWHDTSESANVTTELMKRGYDETALKALWGGNFLRLLAEAERLAT